MPESFSNQEIPKEIGGPQEDLPKESFITGAKKAVEEQVKKPVVKKTYSGVKTAAKWAAGIAGLGAAGKLIYWLGWEKDGEGVTEGSGWFVKPTSPADLSPEEQVEYSRDQQLESYAMRGIGTQMGYRDIKGINDPDFLNPKAETVINFAGKYGASFMFPTYSNENGPEEINHFLVEEMYLNTGYPIEYLNNIWLEASYDPDIEKAKHNRDFALEVLQNSPTKINPDVIRFFQEANRLIDSDLDKETSQDRIENLFKWVEQHIESTSSKEMKGMAGEDFNEAVSAACTVTGADFASVRGAMETAAICAGDPIEVVDAYAYVPTVRDSLVGQMEMSASAYILIPLVLLRLGYESVKSLGKDISAWIDKAEYREMFTSLKELGRKFLLMKK